jgi:hypothetical protein
MVSWSSATLQASESELESIKGARKLGGTMQDILQRCFTTLKKIFMTHWASGAVGML